MADLVQLTTPNEQAQKSENTPGLWGQISNWWGNQSQDDKTGYLGGIAGYFQGQQKQKALDAANEIAVAKAKWAGFHPSWAPSGDVSLPVSMENEVIQGYNAGQNASALNRWAKVQEQIYKAHLDKTQAEALKAQKEAK